MITTFIRLALANWRITLVAAASVAAVVAYFVWANSLREEGKQEVLKDLTTQTQTHDTNANNATLDVLQCPQGYWSRDEDKCKDTPQWAPSSPATGQTKPQ